MRLEYNEEQEKELRITEIEAILENELYENELEEHCLEIELQFLQDNEKHISKRWVKCLNCGHEFETMEIEEDDLGLHCICEECGASFDVDVDEIVERK